MIPQDFITNLIERSDIVEVVGRYVPLKKSGRNFQACCPFHKEKTPSFSVSPSKQIYKCFGCGAGGNALNFIMQYEGLDYPEAIRKLAQIQGVEVPEVHQNKAQQEKTKSLTDFMSEASRFYTESLKKAPTVIEYLKGRQISGEIAKLYGLGYAPEGWQTLEGLFKEKYKDQSLLDCGLVIDKEGRRYDAYRHRLMFPIRNARGHVIGFGARTLKGDEQPKYINSPETPIYHKGRELYGLYEGRESIRKKNRAIVCEGYMDVIQLAQAGFTESVAALGTSITPEHITKLFKLTDEVYFSFDGDTAGQKAARRALEATLSVLTDIQKAYFIILPPEHDPDSLIKAQGPEGFEREIQKAYSITEFIEKVLKKGKNLVFAEERAKLIAEIKPLLLSMQHAPALRLAIVEHFSSLVRIPQEELMRLFGLAAPMSRPSVITPRRSAFVQKGSSRYGKQKFVPEKRIAVNELGRRMTQLFITYPSLIVEFSTAIEEELLDAGTQWSKAMVELWRHGVDEEGAPFKNAASLMQQMRSNEFYGLFEQLIVEEFSLETPLEVAVFELRQAFTRIELERLCEQLSQTVASKVPDMTLVKSMMHRRLVLRETLQTIQKEEKKYRNEMQAIRNHEKEKMKPAGPKDKKALLPASVISIEDAYLKPQNNETAPAWLDETPPVPDEDYVFEGVDETEFEDEF